MDAAADALAESLGAVASELLLATENAADDPNFSISPENCARYGIHCTVVRGMAFIVLSAPLIRPRIVLQSTLCCRMKISSRWQSIIMLPPFLAYFMPAAPVEARFN